MRKQKVIFLIIAVPLYIFYFYIIANFYLIFSALYLVPFIVIALATFKRKDFYLRATKLSILLFLIFIMLFPNIPDWGNQINRRVNRKSVIEPYHPFFFALNRSFYIWFNQSYGIEFDEVTDVVDRLQNISHFIYNPWYRKYTLHPKYFSLLHYSHDYNYPRLAWDHMPSVSDVINNGFTADCTGIAVFTCSFLKFMGFDAYMAEGDSHDFTVVFINGTNIMILPDPLRYEGFRMYFYVAMNPLYLNWWPDVGEPYLLFNERFLIIPRPILSSMLEIYMDPYFFEDYFMPLLNGKLLSPFLSWPLLIGLLFGISFLINYYNKFPRTKKPSRSDLPNIIFGWIGLFIGAIAIFIFGLFGLESLGYLITIITFFIVFLTLDRDFPKRFDFFRRFEGHMETK